MISAINEGISAEEFKQIAQNFKTEGKELDYKDKDGLTALMRAIKNGSPEIAMALIDFAADIHKSDCEGRTAIHYAAQFGCFDIAQSLIHAGCDLNVKDIINWSPLEHAIEGGYPP